MYQNNAIPILYEPNKHTFKYIKDDKRDTGKSKNTINISLSISYETEKLASILKICNNICKCDKIGIYRNLPSTTAECNSFQLCVEHLSRSTLYWHIKYCSKL